MKQDFMDILKNLMIQFVRMGFIPPKLSRNRQQNKAAVKETYE